MARRSLTPRQQELEEAHALLKAEQQLLRIHQRRVAAAKRALAALSCCDLCGAKTMPTGLDLQLCFECSRERAEMGRRALLARYGYGPDGKKLPNQPHSSEPPAAD